MKTQIVNSTPIAALRLLTMGAVVAASLAITHNAKAEAECIDDVAGGVCVAVKSLEPVETKALAEAASANATCDLLAGICEPAPAETVAASELARGTAPLDTSQCDQMAGVCEEVDDSSTEVADTDRRRIRDRIESRKARAEASGTHTERAAHTISTAQE